MSRTYRWIFGLILLTLGIDVPAQMLRVHIRPADRIQKAMYQALGTEVLVTDNDSFPSEILRLHTLELVEIRNESGKVSLWKDGKLVGKYPGLLFWCNDRDARFSISIPAKRRERKYYDHLEILPSATGIKLINRLHIENYLRGVIQAEAGHHRSLDFFKVQALSARTYATRHLNKHGKEGFDMCDQTHCQAYKGVVVNNPMIDRAVDETLGELLSFGEGGLVEAVFSANCGGHTANSEDVWIADVEYLRAVPDWSFCSGFRNHTWHIAMPRPEFLRILSKYHEINATSWKVVPDISGRVSKLIVNDNQSLSISGEEVRRIFHLKSSKFRIYAVKNLLFIEGAGFGHGVGMCQDGAYYMSTQGMDYQEILEHYYKDIRILTIDEMGL